MSQDFTSQTDSTADKGFNPQIGFATGAVCQSSGTYRASNKYMDIVAVVAVGDVFQPGPDGKKTTWYALTPQLSTNSSGGFASVKVAPGTI